MMWGKIKNWFWQEFLGPRNKWRFRRRIALRVRWLYFKRWWRETVSLTGLLMLLLRPVMLLLVGIGVPLLIVSLTGLSFEPRDVVNALKSPNSLDWREAMQAILLFIGLPSAFVLWAFRDANASAALENQRKDINLKEFQEIQLRAAGALDEKLPALARQTLQIAAIHQLRPFLRGEYGKSFRRPAWELLKARLATSAEETGEMAITDWIDRGRFPFDDEESAGDRAWRIADEIGEKIGAIRPGSVTLAERALIREEANCLFRNDLPLQAGRYDGLDLIGTLLARLDLSRAFFAGANLSKVHLEGADLRWAHLEGTKLNEAHLEGADFYRAHLENAQLEQAHLENSHFCMAHLEGAYMNRAHLENADLSMAHLLYANLHMARLEGACLIWSKLNNADFSGACLNHAQLDGVDLESAVLTNAYMRHANLSRASLVAANLRDALLEGANLRLAYLDDRTVLTNAVYDDATIFADDWYKISPDERDAARKPWRDRGMIHVSEVKR